MSRYMKIMTLNKMMSKFRSNEKNSKLEFYTKLKQQKEFSLFSLYKCILLFFFLTKLKYNQIKYLSSWLI